MCTSKPKAPEAIKLPEAPTPPDDSEFADGDVDKRRRRAASGKSQNSTILTSSRGASGGASTGATILGG